MAPRVCSRPGCPTITRGSYCPQHERPNANARGYGAEHRKLRAQWARKVAAGGVNCWRCGEPIGPNEPFDLGHIDGSTAYGGPEHARCNRSNAGRASHER